MRKLSWLWLLTGVLFVFSGCGDDENPPAFPTAPEANAANDNSSKGIYKGVVIGSSGYVKVNIDNAGDGRISLTLSIDGTTTELATDAEYNSETGVFQGYFTGPFGSSTASVGFFVASNGNEYGFFDVEIPGHPNVCLQVIKEKSNALIRCFNGTYTGAQSGILNFVLYENEWQALARGEGETDCSLLEGTINGNTLDCDCDFDGDGEDDIAFSGTVNGNNLSGTYSSSLGSGTWSATRVF